MEHLKELFIGFTSIAQWGPSQRPYVIAKSGFKRDRKKLSGDARRVGKDMANAYEKHGKPHTAR